VTLPEYVHGSLIGAGRYRTAIGAPDHPARILPMAVVLITTRR
jgi:hypothetical protein